MRAMLISAIAVVALEACATTQDRDVATNFCMGAGYEPEDADYESCLRENMMRYRREILLKNLGLANRPSQQTGIKFFYNGPILNRQP